MIKLKNKKVLLIGLLLVLAGAAGYLFVSRGEESPEDSMNTSINQDPAQEKNGTIRLIATGDMIAHDSINANAKTADGYNYLKLTGNMADYFKRADLRFCNQATPAGGEAFGISGYPVFNAPLEFTRDMVRLGCDVVNIGTNHTNDKGQPLINAAVNEWDKQDVLAVAGANRSTAERDDIKLFDYKGVKFAFLSYTTYTNAPVSNGYGVTMYSDALAKSQLQAARDSADVVIVSMRWGTEYSNRVNADQDRLAQHLAHYGADVIFGHGPHVLQPVKKLKANDGREVITWFSLGNFLNSQLEIESLVNGIAVMDISPESKKITDVSFLPVYQHYDWTAQQKAREDLLARKNFTMVPLDSATELLAKSQQGTTVDQQRDRIKSVLNRYTEVPIISSSEY